MITLPLVGTLQLKLMVERKWNILTVPPKGGQFHVYDETVSLLIFLIWLNYTNYSSWSY